MQIVPARVPLPSQTRPRPHLGRCLTTRRDLRRAETAGIERDGTRLVEVLSGKDCHGRVHRCVCAPPCSPQTLSVSSACTLHPRLQSSLPASTVAPPGGPRRSTATPAPALRLWFTLAGPQRAQSRPQSTRYPLLRAGTSLSARGRQRSRSAQRPARLAPSPGMV